MPTVAWTMTLLLVGARTTGMLLVAPVFGHAAVPMRLRVALALGIALALSATAAPAATPADAAQLAIAVAVELALGAAVGYAAALVFAGVELGAAQVAAQMGVSLGEVFSGSGEEEGGPVASLMRMLALAMFLAIGGHRDLIAGLIGTLQAAPAGAGWSPAATVGALVSLLAASFVLALKVAAPVLVALLLAAAALGVLQRVLPQCHFLSTGLPARAVLGLLVLALGTAAMAWALEAAWGMTARNLAGLVKVPA